MPYAYSRPANPPFKALPKQASPLHARSPKAHFVRWAWWLAATLLVCTAFFSSFTSYRATWETPSAHHESAASSFVQASDTDLDVPHRRRLTEYFTWTQLWTGSGISSSQAAKLEQSQNLASSNDDLSNLTDPTPLPGHQGESLSDLSEAISELVDRAQGGGHGAAEGAGEEGGEGETGSLEGLGIVQASELMACDADQRRPYFFQSATEGARSDGGSDPADLDAAAQLINGRQFWLLARTSEQLTKGMLHFAEAALLAKQHKLTLVLPKVQFSYILAFAKYEMCLYLDVNTLSALGDWITLSFLTRVLRHQKKQAEVVHAMMHYYKFPCPSPEQNRSWPALVNRPLDSALATYHMRCFKDVHADALKDKPLLDAFVEANLIQASPSRIMLAEHKQSPLFYFPEDEVQRVRDSIKFAPHLSRAVDKLLAVKGRKFIAVQWRTEKTIIQFDRNETGDMHAHLLACAKGLIDTVEKLQAEGGKYEWIFLASDVLRDGSFSSASLNVRPSKDIRSLKRNQHIQYAVQVRKVLEVKLHPVTWSAVVQDFKEVDSGVQGILDTLVCAQASLFLHPPNSCGATWSSYVQQILRFRGDAASMPWAEAAV